MLKNCLKSHLLALTLLLTACAAGTHSPLASAAPTSQAPLSRALPPLYAYSAAFQAKLQAEADATPPRPCARLDTAPVDCSAARTWNADYIFVRDGLRKLDATPE